MNSNRKTTRSWPVICSQTNRYADDEEDNDDNEIDYETVFALNNNHLHHRNSNDNNTSASYRKYLVVDYQQDTQIEFDSQTNLPRKSIVGRMQPARSSNDGVSAVATSSSPSCTTPPPLIFLLATILMTMSATTMLCVAVMTDHWESITWDRDLLVRLSNNTPNILHWHLNDQVARMPITRKYF